MKRLSLNSEGAFLTTIHKRTPHARNRTSTVLKIRRKNCREDVNWHLQRKDGAKKNGKIVKINNKKISMLRERMKKKCLRDVKVWSHQSVLQRNAFRLSAVRPTITSGGDTSVRINRATLTKPHRMPTFFISEASVIFTALAERTRNITDILSREKIMSWTRKKKERVKNVIRES